MKKYQCSICGSHYKNESEKIFCEENEKITHLTILKVGDLVKIKNGLGSGEYASIVKKIIFDKDWGLTLWEKYWHTEGLIVSLDSGAGRILTFDDYYEDIQKLRKKKLKKIL